MSCEYVVKREAANLPQSTTETLFTVSGGKVLLLGMVGEVTTTVQSQADNIFVLIGADVSYDLMQVNLSGAASGKLIGPTAPGDSSAVVRDAVHPLFADGPVVFRDGGEIQLDCSASNTGQVAWTLWYRPLDPGASIVAN